MNKTITKIEAQNARDYMAFAKQVQSNETIEDKGEVFEIVPIPPRALEEVKTEKLQQANEINAILSARTVTINGLVFPQSYDVVTEWLTFAKFKEDSNLSIPSQAVMYDSLGNNMNSLSAPMITGTMWQLTQAIMTLRADHFALINRINSCTTVEELNAITLVIPEV